MSAYFIVGILCDRTRTKLSCFDINNNREKWAPPRKKTSGKTPNRNVKNNFTLLSGSEVLLILLLHSPDYLFLGCSL
jgi:hypothetical protein